MKMRSRLWLIAIALCLVVGFSGCRQQRQDVAKEYISKLFGGEANIQIISAPETVQAWRTVGFLRKAATDEPAPAEWADFYKKAGEPVTVERALAEELRTRLLDFKTYRYDLGSKNCPRPTPGFVLTFSQGRRSVDVFFCFECNDVVVRAAGGKETFGDIDPSRNELLRLIKRIFPNDLNVQGLPETMR